MSFLSDLLEGLIPDDIENVFTKDLPQATSPDITFQPFTVTSGQGTVTGGPGGTTYSLSQEQQAMADRLFGGATQFYTNAMQDTAVRETDIYNRMRAAQRPEEQRQRLALEERLLSQGRSGVRTNQYGGSPEELAFAKYQAERQDNAMLTAMQQAQAEQAQQATLGSQFLQQSYAPQAAMLSAFAPALDVASMADVARRQQGEFDMEAQIANINAALGQQTGLAQLYGSVYSGLLGGIGSALGTGSTNPWWWPSDVTLKENIKKVGVTDRGINLYTWDWKEGYEEIVGNQPNFGVLAQEVIDVIPEAVMLGDDGYYRVNYAEVLVGGQ